MNSNNLTKEQAKKMHAALVPPKREELFAR
jgi:hypothetical protein